MTTEQLLLEFVQASDKQDPSFDAIGWIERARAALSHPAAASSDPIYQYQMADGSWIDQAKSSYDYNVKHGAATVRIVYTTPPASQPQALGTWKPIEAAPENMTGVVVVRWKDSEGNEQHDFDYTEDGCWMKWHEHAEHVQMIGGHGVSYTPPYTHFMEMPPCINGMEVKP